jgi:hypothetical protein
MSDSALYKHFYPYVRFEVFMAVTMTMPHQCYPHLIMLVGFECSWDPESYTGGSIAAGRATQAGQVEG